jgi:acyl-CoA thioesterase-1
MILAAAMASFATTTPVPNGGIISPTRRFGSVEEYNAIALRVMKEGGVLINDLNTLITPHLAKVQKPNDVHYTSEGSAILGKQVTEKIAEALK